MELKKICIDEAFLNIDQESITLHREDGFLLITNSNNGNVLSQVKSIINQKLTPPNIYLGKDEEKRKKYIQGLIKDKNLPEPAVVIFNRSNLDKVQIVTHAQVTAIISADLHQKQVSKSFSLPAAHNTTGRNISLHIMLLINEKLDFQTLLNLFMTATQAKTAILWDLDVRSVTGEILEGDNEDSLLIACTGYMPSEKMENTANIANTEKMQNNLELKISVQKCVKEATSNLLKDNGYPKTIIDFIADCGVQIDDLVRAGMELLVEVEETPELRLQLQDQILKSLKDVNVISLVLAGIRLEEDYARHRIAEVNVENDPAYLFADEVLGMAIANQIAGTKAIFNFKRYDEEKPGIIRELGPILDDVFAGVVAGSMSKIFEE
jgi:alpha-ribazole phosphatase CobZ